MISKNDIQIKLGRNIAISRKNNGFTQIALADLLDLERQSINRIEKGGTNISVYLLIKISVVLNVKPEELLNFTDF